MDNFYSDNNNRMGRRRSSLGNIGLTINQSQQLTDKEDDQELKNYAFPRHNSFGFENVFMIETDIARKMSIKENMLNLNASNGILLDAPRYDEVETTFWSRLIDKLYNICGPCLRQNHNLPENPTRVQRLKYNLLCPPAGLSAKLITCIVTAMLAYGVLWSITRSEALPGGNFFSLLVLILCGYVGGKIVHLLTIPPLFGMLLVGIALRNVPYINVGKDIDDKWSFTLRNIALCVILIRAGLGLDSKALKKLKLTLFLVAVVPCLIEAFTVAVLAHYMLDFPWIWAFILGFVFSAASPSIIVSCMLRVMKAGYGLDRGIPTLLIAATTIDDVIAISVFSILLGVLFAGGSTLTMNILRGPLEVLIGLVYGVLLGIFSWYLPNEMDKYMISFRFLLLLFGGLFALFVSRAVEFSGAGALGVLSFAFIASRGWRRQGWKKANPVGDSLKVVWTVLEPTLFSLVGSQINFSQLEAKSVGYGVAIIVISVVGRMLATTIALTNNGFSWKEKLYTSIGRCAKATVQAAIGSTALDTAREKDPNNEIAIELGKKILNLAVLAILLTAPIGSALITMTAPKLLNRITDPLSTGDPEKVDTSALTEVNREAYEDSLDVIAKQGYENEGFTYSDASAMTTV